MQQQVEIEECLTSGGEMDRLMRSHDWSATPLDPVEDWPRSLKTAVRIMLGSCYPMFIWWGWELVNLDNDSYLPMLGKRHPAALGKPAAVIWSEIWDAIGPQTEAVLYEVALLDLGMPKLNGYDAARRIREEWPDNGIVLIVLTGWGQEEDPRSSKEAGFNHPLVKPVDPATLEKLLAEVRSETV